MSRYSICNIRIHPLKNIPSNLVHKKRKVIHLLSVCDIGQNKRHGYDQFLLFKNDLFLHFFQISQCPTDMGGDGNASCQPITT